MLSTIFKNLLSFAALNCVLFQFLFLQSTFAIDRPSLLPEGVRLGFLTMGRYYGLNQYYSDNGELKSLADKNSFELSGRELEQVNSAFADLVRILNEFGQSSLGSQLHLGQIQVVADPEVRFYAPTFAYGISPKITMGMAVPIITYSNNIQVLQTGANTNYIRQQIGGQIQDIDNALDQLDRAVAGGLNSQLTNKGYKPLQSKNESFLGDIVLFTAYAFDPLREYAMKSALRFFVNLPTGPKPDPDDLADLESFNQLSFKFQGLAEFDLFKDLQFIIDAYYLFVPGRKVVKRVPTGPNDVLPSHDQRRTVTENKGDTIGASLGLSYNITEQWGVLSALAFENKLKDTYPDLSRKEESYLNTRTDKSAQIVKFQVVYSTVQSYLKKKSLIPGMIDYELAQTIAGRNIENQTSHLLTFSLFF